MNPRELERFLKFAMVGVIGAIVDFGTFNLLRPFFVLTAGEQVVWALDMPLWGELAITEESIALGLVSGISFVAAIISNFVWNRYWTYPDSRTKSFRRQFVQFFVVNAAGVFIRVPLVTATHNWFADMLRLFFTDMNIDTAVLLGDNLAVALAVGIVMFWNFFVNRYWTYNDVE